MHSDTFIQGLARVLNCSKVHIAATGLVTTWFAVRYAAADLPPTQRASLWVAFIGAVAVQLREIINAWTEEDVARVMNAGMASPAGANLSAADALSLSPPNPPAAEPPGLSSSASPGETQSVPIAADAASSLSESFMPRSSNMPPRTTLPLVLIVSSMLVIFAAGCQTPPELSTYREGLHQVDEPLYQAHLLLMNDAVAANLRTDADRQVVQAGIAAAESLYQQSKATEAAGVSATQPGN